MAQKRLSEATKKRLKAGRMLLAGKGCTDVAKAVGVARQTVYPWKGLLDEGGIDALRAVPERGRPAQLDEQQLAAVRATLLRSPTEYGFGTGSAIGVSIPCHYLRCAIGAIGVCHWGQHRIHS
ncbi:MAG: helix-turn-helix domain-containing protein [Propionivibrio sp.]|nr:helix-turn-helix domain-containing protein [Propionivibrio sp.]